MLKLQDTNAKTIKTWEHISLNKTIVFSVHNSELLQFYRNEINTTVFYGFLDQDCPHNNAAQYISEMLDKRGIKALNDCYGSFIIIHFNKIKQQYFIANDAMGDFAVHYTEGEKSLHISDLPGALLNNTNSSINQQRLLHYFALSKPQNNGSFFEKINQLNPGHCLTVSQLGQSIDRYYQPELILNSQNISIEELAEKYKSLIQQIIQYQTQGHNKVGVMMSGGMDSTFVAANCQKANKQVNTYSYVFPNMPNANESMWIDSMRDRGFNMHTFAGESYWPLKSPWQISLNAPINNPYRHLKSVIYQQAHTQGIKYLLTGVFADHLYTGYIYWLVDQIRSKPFTAIKSLFHTTRNKGMLTCLRQVSPAKFSGRIKSSSPWMSKNAQVELKAQQTNLDKFKHPHPQQFDLVYGISTAQSAWLENEHAFKHKVFVRHPFRDRRVVEFLMALPAWVLGDINNPKRFVRYTAKNLLPKSIVNRNKISTLLPLFSKGVFDKEWHKVKDILTDSSCQWHYFVKKDYINKLIQNPEEQHKESEQVILWQCLNYELWRRRIAATSP